MWYSLALHNLSKIGLGGLDIGEFKMIMAVVSEDGAVVIKGLTSLIVQKIAVSHFVFSIKVEEPRSCLACELVAMYSVSIFVGFLGCGGMDDVVCRRAFCWLWWLKISFLLPILSPIDATYFVIILF